MPRFRCQGAEALGIGLRALGMLLPFHEMQIEMQRRSVVRAPRQDDFQSPLRELQRGIVGFGVARTAMFGRDHVCVRGCGLQRVILGELIGKRLRGASRRIVVDGPGAVPRYIAGALGRNDAPALVGQSGCQRLSAIQCRDGLRHGLKRDRVVDRRR
jgi:hypothetical protein